MKDNVPKDEHSTTPTPQESAYEDIKGASTYSVLTAQRILERFNFSLSEQELIEAVNRTDGAYFHLLRVPMQNVFNGIILQQSIDYQVYAQKLYVDYLLSGESNKDENFPGADTREELEEHRLKLVNMGEEFADLQLEHKTLIADSQKYFKEHTRTIQPQQLDSISQEIQDGIDKFEPQVIAMKERICRFREQFYQLILEVTAMLQALPDFHMDEHQIEENKESLHFDTKIGEEGDGK